jgi:8-oxo-dGTP pyrophosphatase MutT (NUDIX family)
MRAPSRIGADVVGGLLLDEAGRILLVQRRDHGSLAPRWGSPGGEVAPGELHQDVLVRELREELGVEVNSVDAQAVASVAWTPEDGTPVRWRLHRVRTYGGAPRPPEGHGIGWFDPAEMTNLRLAPGNEAAILTVARESLLHVYGDRPFCSCGECGASVRLVTGPGRTRQDARGRPMRVPDDYPTPVCSRCGETVMAPEVSEPLDHHVRAAACRSVTLAQEVAGTLRARCADVPGVGAVWMAPDGTDFVVTGDTWTEELSALGAQVAVDVQTAHAPSGVPYIEGGFHERVDCPAGWVAVFDRGDLGAPAREEGR